MIIDDDIDIKSLLPENQGSTVDEFISTKYEIECTGGQILNFQNRIISDCYEI
jgi:hypothetical protein